MRLVLNSWTQQTLAFRTGRPASLLPPSGGKSYFNEIVLEHLAVNIDLVCTGRSHVVCQNYVMCQEVTLSTKVNEHTLRESHVGNKLVSGFCFVL